MFTGHEAGIGMIVPFWNGAGLALWLVHSETAPVTWVRSPHEPKRAFIYFLFTTVAIMAAFVLGEENYIHFLHSLRQVPLHMEDLRLSPLAAIW